MTGARRRARLATLPEHLSGDPRPIAVPPLGSATGLLTPYIDEFATVIVGMVDAATDTIDVMRQIDQLQRDGALSVRDAAAMLMIMDPTSDTSSVSDGNAPGGKDQIRTLVGALVESGGGNPVIVFGTLSRPPMGARGLLHQLIFATAACPENEGGSE